MSYYGNLNKGQIASAEEIKRNIISAMNEEFAIIRGKYDSARKHGLSVKEREYRLELHELSNRLERIQKMYLSDVLRKYPKFVNNLQKEFSGEFELERPQTAKILFFLVIVSAVFLSRYFNQKLMIAFILIAGTTALFYASFHKTPPKLVAVKA